jgi:hypothetical protein
VVPVTTNALKITPFVVESIFSIPGMGKVYSFPVLVVGFFLLKSSGIHPDKTPARVEAFHLPLGESRFRNQKSKESKEGQRESRKAPGNKVDHNELVLAAI